MIKQGLIPTMDFQPPRFQWSFFLIEYLQQKKEVESEETILH